MRLLIINSHGKLLSQKFLRRYSSVEIGYDFSDNIREALEGKKSLDNYEGVLMHPPLGHHGEKFHKMWLEEVRKISPDIRIAFATNDLGDTPQRIDPGIDIPLIDFQDIRSIKNYFEKRK